MSREAMSLKIRQPLVAVDEIGGALVGERTDGRGGD